MLVVLIQGIATFSNFKTGSTNVHNIGCWKLVGDTLFTKIGGDTPIGSGATIYDEQIYTQ